MQKLWHEFCGVPRFMKLMAAYLARCSVLDTQAAGRIMNLERKLALAENRCASEFEREVERMLRVLREP